MTFEQLFAILKARWLVALGVFALVVGAVTAKTLLKSKDYTATGSVVVDIKSPDPIAGMVLSGAASPTYLVTQTDVITSQRVALKVVSDLKLNEVPMLRQNWMDATKGTGDFKGWLADLFRHSLKAQPSRGSNVINVSFTSADPQFAATITNAFIRAYLDVNLQLRTEPAKQYSRFFNQNGKQLREGVESAQARLSKFQQEQGLVVTDERLDVEMARLNELSTQLVQMQSAVADSNSRQAAVNARGDQTQDVMMNPLVSSLKASLTQQENQLQLLGTKLGEEHPQVKEMRNGIADLREKLATEVRRVSGSFGISNSVNVARESQIRIALDAQRAKVLKMKATRDQAAMLQRDLDSAQRAHDNMVLRQNNTQLESQAFLDNVAPLEYATAPAVPSGPNVTHNIALGMLAGAAAGLAAAILLERQDRRLRTFNEIESLTQLPAVGLIPAFKTRAKSTPVPRRLQLLPRRLNAQT